MPGLVAYACNPITGECDKWTPGCAPHMTSSQHHVTFLLPGGAGSKIRVCISLGRAEYTGRMINSGTSGPSDFILSYRISQAVSISSWPVKKTKMSPRKRLKRHSLSLALLFFCVSGEVQVLFMSATEPHPQLFSDFTSFATSSHSVV